MNTNTRLGNAERFGRWLGQSWRGYVRRERLAAGWLVVQGLPAGGATALLWIAKLAVLGALLYAAFWLTLLFVFVIATAWLANRSDEDALEQSQGADDEEHDHRKSVFYHPLSYSDDPDPRFEDD
ncbi:DUF3742 family protein [Thauera propionica]|jgi:hypothetical protein|uniref:DUF3742 family protein n=1 Tax=Thauera propionica TaxID=2019431 RepID=UPI0023F4C583|nr:DUF3742 family protein [Thauera propionica]MDD3673886.1 DUF3742 family protein [Thauera propionica]MDX9716887.1 DUF3742 family protein [Thauera sp.]